MKHNKVLIDRSHLEFLLWTSMRYCMGRKTYVTSSYEDVVKSVKHLIHPTVKEGLVKDLKREMDLAKERGEFLGQACDHESWEEVLHALTFNKTRGV